MVVVINGNSGDGGIRRIKPLGDSDVKLRRNSIEENACNKSL
jgi:hypothetical protein